ncbi:MAG TPA: glycosyltransferase [Gemmatimonadales bacterium]|jgi:glycosyltransferase involved in cell wall biosynthesis|nr:glycosyltransferase [Gemmatimonadales bacterium]
MKVPFRIAHLTRWLLPSEDTATHQLVQTASALARAGAAIDLVLPSRPRHRVPEAELREQLRRQYGTECAFGIHQVPSRISSSEWLSDAAQALLGSLFASPRHYGVVHTRDLETALLCHRLGRRVLFENYRPLTRRSRLHRAALVHAARHPRFLGVITHSRFIAEKYQADGIPPQKVRTAYNGFDPAPFAIERSPQDARRALRWPEQPTVVYAGRIGTIKRIDLLLDAAQQTPEVQWVLAGPADRAEAQSFVARGNSLPNVRFPGFQRGECLALTLQAADILVLPPSLEALNTPGQGGLPIKLFHYLPAGRPILAPDVPDTAELLVDDQNSVRVPPHDGVAFLNALRGLLADPARRIRLGAGARRTAEGHTWDARALTLLSFLLDRLGASPA